MTGEQVEDFPSAIAATIEACWAFVSLRHTLAQFLYQ